MLAEDVAAGPLSVHWACWTTWLYGTQRVRTHARERLNRSLCVAADCVVRTRPLLRMQVSPVLQGLVKEGKLKIVGGVYDLATGKVTEIA